jgi:Fe2+ transport system protein FeoA
MPPLGGGPVVVSIGGAALAMGRTLAARKASVKRWRARPTGVFF